MHFRTMCWALKLAVVTVTLPTAVHAQTRLNLVGVNGETACSLRDRMNTDSCGTIAVREVAALDVRADEFIAIPSSCTCTTPFFNIWSVCGLFESRWNTLPLLKDWKAQCHNSNVVFRGIVGAGTLGSTELPEWSRVNAPDDDAVFDVAGIVLSMETRRWTSLQIITPVISAVGLLAIVVAGYLLCVMKRNNGSRRTLRRGPRLPIFFRTWRVKSEEPRGDWVIDTRPEQGQEIPPSPGKMANSTQESGSTPDTPNYPQSRLLQPQAAATHHISLSPQISKESGSDARASWYGTKDHSKWSESIHHPLSQAARGPKEGIIPKFLKNVPNPFKLKAKPELVEITATPRVGFRLDDYDLNTESMLSKSSVRTASQSDGDRWSVGGSLQLGNLGGNEDEEQTERANLISGKERQSNGVFLISRNGENFSISDRTAGTLDTHIGTLGSEGTNSQINVVSPTASTMSWRYSNHNHTAMPVALPASLPPPPRRPPPISPPLSSPEYPLANIADTPLPNRQRSGSEGSNDSSKTLRLAPVTVNQTVGATAPRSNLLHPPLRTVYEGTKYPSSDTSPESSEPQGYSAPHIVLNGKAISAPSPPPPLHAASKSPPQPSQQSSNRQRSSKNVRASKEVRLLPLSPMGPRPHKRNAASDDDASSFYLSAAESSSIIRRASPMPHERKGSVESLGTTRRSDPINLFPASVRGAGYNLHPT